MLGSTALVRTTRIWTYVCINALGDRLRTAVDCPRRLTVGDESTVGAEGLSGRAVNASVGGVECGTAEERAKGRSSEHVPSKERRARQSAAERGPSKRIVRLPERRTEERIIER